MTGNIENTLIEKASKWLQRLGKEFKFSHTDLYRIELCLGELIANVVSYSDPQYANQPLELHASIEPHRAILTLIDPASPFDPLSYPTPPIAETIDEIQVGGQGIHLALEFSDGFRYERLDNRNRVELVFNLEKC
jgi:anti-sigma regulatory factor (Ser/Thr protein kinase)